ncbi:MAG: hypothetical protein QM783_11100 [Phycisphaerales bacterium]
MVDQHLAQVGAVRLVLRQVKRQLHRPADAVGILGHQQHTLARSDAHADLAPKRSRAIARDRQHEADRSTALHAIDKHVGQLIDLRLIDRAKTPDGDARDAHMPIE